ncbi:choice-of-anchor M domain-containing protein [Arcanobacterium canis]|uniref:choice-of-anchor M domain-containing protein n=1 Tax=Arcanobacterium canis TaxID=999183 RepID=UPI0036162E3A
MITPWASTAQAEQRPVATQSTKIGAEAKQADAKQNIEENIAILRAGHTDALSVVENGDGISIVTKEDVSTPGAPTYHNPARMVFFVDHAQYTSATMKLPQIKSSGYYLPESINGNTNILWPGWDSLAIARLKPQMIKYRVTQIDAPSPVFLWSNGEFGSMKKLADDWKLAKGSIITQNEPAHQHANWLFSKKGVYRITFEAEIETASGKMVSEPATLTFAVDTDPYPVAQKNAEQLAKLHAGVVGANPVVKITDINKNVTKTRESAPTLGSSSSLGNAGAKSHPSSPAGIVTQLVEECIPTPITVNVPAKTQTQRTSVSYGSHVIRQNTHVHPNWVFTKPGTYKVQIAQSAKLRSGSSVRTTGTLTFNVGGSGNANSGHFDIGTTASANAIRMLVKDDRTQPARWVDPSTLVFGVGNAARTQAPKGIEFVAKAGQPIWVISSAQVSGVPWVGANTMHPDLVKYTTGEVTWQLQNVTGPGDVAVFESGNFGEIGRRWFNATGSVIESNSPAFTQTVRYEGRTPNGELCDLSAAQLSALAANGKLVQTGATVTPLIAIVVIVLLIGVAFVLLRWRLYSRRSAEQAEQSTAGSGLDPSTPAGENPVRAASSNPGTLPEQTSQQID